MISLQQVGRARIILGQLEKLLVEFNGLMKRIVDEYGPALASSIESEDGVPPMVERVSNVLKTLDTANAGMSPVDIAKNVTDVAKSSVSTWLYKSGSEWFDVDEDARGKRIFRLKA